MGRSYSPRQVFGPDGSYHEQERIRRGYGKVSALFEATIARLNVSSRSTYLKEAPVERGLKSITNNVVTILGRVERGEDFEGTLALSTIYGLACVILVPGKDEYFGDTPEGLSLFLQYALGELDGVPAHLKTRSVDSMNLEALKLERDRIDARIAELSICVETVTVVDLLTTCTVDSYCTVHKISRTELARETIGVKAFHELLGSDRLFTESQIQSLADRLGGAASDILAMRRLSIATWNAKNKMNLR